MPTFNENVDVNGQLSVTRGWSDWVFLRQQRDTGGGGGFHFHNPWGNSTQGQGHASRNRLEIGYRTGSGQDLWGQVVIHGPTGRVGLGVVDPQARLHVDGSIIVTDDVILANADCAEEFDLAPDEELLEPGTVTVLDDDGRLRRSDTPYDTRAAGIVAGGGDLRPGIVLGHRDDGDGHRAVIALAGRTYCRVDAGFGPIRPGALLTTSENPGHAMRVRDRREAVGAVVGKALRPCESGTDMIPVLVALG